MDITELVLAVASAVISLALPYAALQFKRWTGITLAENDRKALNDLLDRAIAAAVTQHAGSDGKITFQTRTKIGRAVLKYAVENSPDLIKRVTGGPAIHLQDRINAQLAKDFPPTERN
jgi:hypothetical protein